MELLCGLRPKCESLPLSVEVHDHLAIYARVVCSLELRPYAANSHVGYTGTGATAWLLSVSVDIASLYKLRHPLEMMNVCKCVHYKSRKPHVEHPYSNFPFSCRSQCLIVRRKHGGQSRPSCRFVRRWLHFSLRPHWRLGKLQDYLQPTLWCRGGDFPSCSFPPESAFRSATQCQEQILLGCYQQVRRHDRRRICSSLSAPAQAHAEWLSLPHPRERSHARQRWLEEGRLRHRSEEPGWVRVLLVVQHHRFRGGTALQKDWQARLAFRRAVGRLLKTVRKQRLHGWPYEQRFRLHQGFRTGIGSLLPVRLWHRYRPILPVRQIQGCRLRHRIRQYPQGQRGASDCSRGHRRTCLRRHRRQPPRIQNVPRWCVRWRILLQLNPRSRCIGCGLRLSRWPRLLLGEEQLGSRVGIGRIHSYVTQQGKPVRYCYCRLLSSRLSAVEMAFSVFS